MQMQSYEVRGEAPDHQSTSSCGTEGQPPYCVTSSGQPSPRATGDTLNRDEVSSSKTEHRSPYSHKAKEGRNRMESEKKTMTADPQMHGNKFCIGKVHI
jgi:hypothetical protein